MTTPNQPDQPQVVPSRIPPQQAPPSQPVGEGAGVRMLIPVGRSGWAIGAGYAGLMALFPICGAIFGPLAIVFGFLGYFDIKKNPQRHGMGRVIFAFVAGGIGTLFNLAMIIGLIVSRGSGR
jgi:hypothetical protein